MDDGRWSKSNHWSRLHFSILHLHIPIGCPKTTLSSISRLIWTCWRKGFEFMHLLRWSIRVNWADLALWNLRMLRHSSRPYKKYCLLPVVYSDSTLQPVIIIISPYLRISYLCTGNSASAAASYVDSVQVIKQYVMCLLHQFIHLPGRKKHRNLFGLL